MKYILPISSLKTLFSSLIQSHINYGLSIWGTSHTLNKVYKLQNKSVRIIHNKPYNYHTEPLFKHSKILKIEDQYKLNAVTLKHQLKHNKLPTSFNSFFFTNNRLPTRQQDLAKCSRFRTSLTSKIPLYKFLRLWNEILPVCHKSKSKNVYIKQRFKHVYLTPTQIKLNVTMTHANTVIQTYMYETLTENMSGMIYVCHESIALVYLVKIMVKKCNIT